MFNCFCYLRYLLTATALLWPQTGCAELAATDIAIDGDERQTTINITFDGLPQAQPMLLSNPHRLVLDLPQTLFAIGKKEPPSDAMVSSFRSGLMQEDRSRMIFGIKGPFKLKSVEAKPGADGKHQILQISLHSVSDAEFKVQLDDQSLSTSSTTAGKSDRVIKVQDDGLFKVVIDPGHGGIDSGATGLHGTAEKEVTLKFATELKEALAGNGKIDVFVTRDDDRFIALGERVKIARQLDADLFISVHADSISDKRLRGATIYTLSDKASDEVAQAVALNENLADSIGGVENGVVDEVVADILIDLTRRETMQYSVEIARNLVSALKDKTILINNSHRSAGFKVLKAPDIPSVLVELGYLSNEDDEKQITDPQWRKKIAAELAAAIREHAQRAVAQRQ